MEIPSTFQLNEIDYYKIIILIKESRFQMLYASFSFLKHKFMQQSIENLLKGNSNNDFEQLSYKEISVFHII